MRESEATGLLVEDVSFDRSTIEIRTNRYRRLKTSKSRRTVRIWPQLAPILREHVFGGPGGPRTTGLLFPSMRTGGMITDLRKMFDGIAALAGLPEGLVRTRVLRVTYTAARLQTVDRGQPVAVYTVAGELGHASDAMVRNVYGRLGQIRYRSEVVEYSTDGLLRDLKVHDGAKAARAFAKQLTALRERAAA